MLDGKFRFLGTGSSLGVPIVCCKCAVCTSVNPKNKRWRSSSLLEVSGRKFLLDAGPDYRTQALHYGIDEIHGFILTHAHYDHMGGFEDLKVYAHKKEKVPCLLLAKTFEELRSKHVHLFQEMGQNSTESPFFTWTIYKSSFGQVLFAGLPLEILSFSQVGMPVMGIRVGNLAYISDIKEYSEELAYRLQGIDTLIISAPRKSRSPLHFSIDDALQFASLVRAKKTYLTHIAHEVDHEALEKELPSSVFLAYDGLTLSFLL
ncbi:MAG: MBL fold metallo-hydrolase [Chlamydiae bacterium]|nr:MBL fold metallo-hydrolase [Chlamydiota bacterium]